MTHRWKQCFMAVRIEKWDAGFFNPAHGPDYFLALDFPAISLRYFSGSLLKSLTQLLQHNFTSWPSLTMTTGFPISPSLSPETIQVVSGYGLGLAAKAVR